MKHKHACPDIALFIPSLAGGGAERVMLTLAEGFATRGLKVDLVVVRATGVLIAEVPKNVKLVDLQASRTFLSVLPLVRYLRRERPKAMLAAMSHANCVAVWARSLSGIQIKLAISEHSTLTQAVAAAVTLRDQLMPMLMRLTYRHADKVVAVSCGVADDLASAILMPRDRIDVIHNPIVFNSMLAKSHMPVSHSWFAPGQLPVILGVGRLVTPKDFQNLVHAFAQIRRTRQAKLVILGEGEKRAELDALVVNLGLTEDVSMPGFVSNPYAYMRQSAVFVLSSRWEGLPTVVVEAMACGTPVVSTDCPSGPCEILENGKWGRLVPVNNAHALADGIIATLEETSHPDSMKRAQVFSVDAALNKYALMLDLSI